MHNVICGEQPTRCITLNRHSPQCIMVLRILFLNRPRETGQRWMQLNTEHTDRNVRAKVCLPERHQSSTYNPRSKEYCFKSKHFHVLEWPSQRSVLNLIENLWWESASIRERLNYFCNEQCQKEFLSHAFSLQLKFQWNLVLQRVDSEGVIPKVFDTISFGVFNK